MASAPVESGAKADLSMQLYIDNGVVPFSLVTVVVAGVRLALRLPFYLQAPTFAQPTIDSATVETTEAEVPFALYEVIGLIIFLVVALLQLVPKARELAARKTVVAALFALPILAAAALAIVLAIISTANMCVSFGKAEDWTCKGAVGTYQALSACAYDPRTETRNTTSQGPCKTGPSPIDLGGDACVCQRSVLWPTDDDLLASVKYNEADEGAKKCPSGSTVYTGLTLCAEIACNQGTQGSGSSCTCEKEVKGSQTRCFITDMIISTHACDTIASERDSNTLNLYIVCILAWPLASFAVLIGIRVMHANTAELKAAGKPTEGPESFNPLMLIVVLPFGVLALPAFLGWQFISPIVWAVLVAVTPMGCCASRWPPEKRAVLTREGYKCIFAPKDSVWNADKPAAAAAPV